MQLITSVIPVAVFLNVHFARAQASSSTFSTCSDIDCPSLCTVVDKSFSDIGVISIPTTSELLSGLTWTEGVNWSQYQKLWTFNKSFYFGTPPDKNLTDVGACAVFFTELIEDVTFGKDKAKGTCQDALTAECVDALNKRALEVELSCLSNVDACQKL